MADFIGNYSLNTKIPKNTKIDFPPHFPFKGKFWTLLQGVFLLCNSADFYKHFGVKKCSFVANSLRFDHFFPYHFSTVCSLEDFFHDKLLPLNLKRIRGCCGKSLNSLYKDSE